MAIGHEEKGKFEYNIILSGNEYFFGVELADVDLDGLDEIIFSSGGGAHYNSLSIYKYKKGDAKVLFRNGSACGISIEGGKPFTIKVGREKWDEPGWSYAAGTDAFEVWKWDGKGFSYDSKLSTSKMVSENQATDEYVKRVSSKLEEIRKGKVSEQGQPLSDK